MLKSSSIDGAPAISAPAVTFEFHSYFKYPFLPQKPPVLTLTSACLILSFHHPHSRLIKDASAAAELTCATTNSRDTK